MGGQRAENGDGIGERVYEGRRFSGPKPYIMKPPEPRGEG
jgi:hypothetical protein